MDNLTKFYKTIKSFDGKNKNINKVCKFINKNVNSVFIEKDGKGYIIYFNDKYKKVKDVYELLDILDGLLLIDKFNRDTFSIVGMTGIWHYIPEEDEIMSDGEMWKYYEALEDDEDEEI